jgi:hypothetical protein
MITDIKVFIDHKQLCEILDVTPSKCLANLELIYRPDAEMWLIIGKCCDTEDEMTEVLES